MLSVCEPWLDTGGPVRPLLVAIDANWIALLCVLLGPRDLGWVDAGPESLEGHQSTPTPSAPGDAGLGL